MSEKINVDQAFNPEARQAQSDFDSYLESRPYKDEYGNTRNTEGKVVGSSYFDTQRDQHETDTLPTAYEDMSMPDLARALASAEHQEDKTKAGDIQDTLIEKMAEFTEKNNLDSDAQDNLYNRIMKVKDAESEKLDGKGVKNEKSDDDDDLFIFDNPEGPARDKEIADKEREVRKIDVDDDEIFGEPSKKSSTVESVDTDNSAAEYVVTTDLDEAKTYWESELKDQGIVLEDYLSHEKAWLVKKEIKETKPNAPIIDPEKPDDDEDPQVLPPVTIPPVDPITPEPLPNDPPTEIVPPVIPERTPRPERKRKTSKWMRGLIAGLALFASGYTAGRVNENYIVKSHDTPAVDSINKMQDNTRNLPVDMQEEMASNYERTQDFFEGISTKVGAEDFKNFEKMYTDTINELTAKHGSSLTKERIEELAQKKVIAQLAALDLHQAEASISK